MLAIASPVLMLGACDSNLKLSSEAMVFQDTAEKCLLDVRDHHLQFEQADHCQALQGASKRYISAGGQTEDESAEIALIAERGRVAAWQARAISAANDPSLSLW